jgi:transposase-like protein
VTLGSRADRQRVVLDRRRAGQETAQAWEAVSEKLVERHVGVPQLAIIDGNPALRAQWPQIAIQRWTAHKLRHLLSQGPVHLHTELVKASGG